MGTNAAETGLALISSWRRPVRWIGIAFLALVLLIPLKMVESVVRERHQTILKAEDFALLGGTLLLLVALSVTMVLTRRIHEPRAGV